MSGKHKTPKNKIRNPWHTSMLTLCMEPAICLEAILCPCIAYHDASKQFEVVPADSCEACCGGFCCCCGFDLRSRLRTKYNLKGHDVSDFCIHCWCHCCGIAQILREAKIQNKLPQSPISPTFDGDSTHSGNQGKVPNTDNNTQETQKNKLESNNGKPSGLAPSITDKFDNLIRNTFGKNSSIRLGTIDSRNKPPSVITEERDLTVESGSTFATSHHKKDSVSERVYSHISYEDLDGKLPKTEVTRVAHELHQIFSNDEPIIGNDSNEKKTKLTPKVPVPYPKTSKD